MFKPLHIIVLNGGLGNQMSQYALFYSKKALGHNVAILLHPQIGQKHNGYLLDTLFFVERPLSGFLEALATILFRSLAIRKYPLLGSASRLLLSLFFCNIIFESDDYSFHPTVLKRSRLGITFFFGGWHSEKYFLHASNHLYKLFSNLKPNAASLLESFLDSTNASSGVGLHIRRGDYMKNHDLSKFGSVCKKSYFINALSVVQRQFPGRPVFIITDDPEWAKNNLDFSPFIVLAPAVPKGYDWLHLYLLSSCQGIVMSNSTFSWWAAWLAERHEALIYRPRFFISTSSTPDIYPSRWRIIDDDPMG